MFKIKVNVKQKGYTKYKLNITILNESKLNPQKQLFNVATFLVKNVNCFK